MSVKKQKKITYKDFATMAKSWNKSTCIVHSTDRLSSDDDFLDKYVTEKTAPPARRLTQLPLPFKL